MNGLIKALEEARAGDRILLEEIRSRKNRRRLIFLWSSFCVAIILAVLVGLTFIKTKNVSAIDAPDKDSYIHITTIDEINAEISVLEQRLKKPGGVKDYEKLGFAYNKRYQLTKNKEDLKNGKRAFEKAKYLRSKLYKEGFVLRKPIIFGLVFIGIAVCLITLYAMVLYNGLVDRDEAVDVRWAQVEAVLQRRLDLIPGLVESVKGYAKHERETLTQVMEARAKMSSLIQQGKGIAPKNMATVGELDQASDGLSAALTRLLALAEKYPNLKASSNFLSLQDQLEGTENRIAVERQRFNTTVNSYNAKLRKFPSNIIGGMFGFEPRAYFESKEKADEPVDIKF